MAKFLDLDGLQRVWGKVKSVFLPKSANMSTSDIDSAIGDGAASVTPLDNTLRAYVDSKNVSSPSPVVEKFRIQPYLNRSNVDDDDPPEPRVIGIYLENLEEFQRQRELLNDSNLSSTNNFAYLFMRWGKTKADKRTRWRVPYWNGHVRGSWYISGDVWDQGSVAWAKGCKFYVDPTSNFTSAWGADVSFPPARGTESTDFLLHRYCDGRASRTTGNHKYSRFGFAIFQRDNSITDREKWIRVSNIASFRYLYERDTVSVERY